MTEYEKAFRQAETHCGRDGLGRLDLSRARGPMGRKYSFAILTQETVELLKGYGPILEVGAGTGYWAHELRKAGADVVATDVAPGKHYGFECTYPDVIPVSAAEAIRTHGQGRTLLMVWPCYKARWSAKALRDYRRIGGTRVIYVGEDAGGCTGGHQFHWQLRNQWERKEEHTLPQWPGIHDYLTVYERSNKQGETKHE